MRPIAALLILVTAMFAAAPAQAQPSIPSPPDLPKLYAQAMAAGDVEAIVAFYAPNAILMTPEGPVAAGADAIRALMTRNFAGGVALGMTFNQAQLDGGNGHAVMVWDWLLHIELDGQPPQQRHVRSMLYLKQGEDADWLIAADMYQILPQ